MAQSVVGKSESLHFYYSVVLTLIRLRVRAVNIFELYDLMETRGE